MTERLEKNNIFPLHLLKAPEIVSFALKFYPLAYIFVKESD